MAGPGGQLGPLAGFNSRCHRFHGWPRIRQAGLMLVQPRGLAQQPVSRAHSGPNPKLTSGSAPPPGLRWVSGPHGVVEAFRKARGPWPSPFCRRVSGRGAE